MKLSPMALLLALMLTACGGSQDRSIALTPIPAPPSTGANTGTSAIDPLCSQIRIVELSRFDTTGTKEQVIGNNAVIDKVCNGRE